MIDGVFKCPVCEGSQQVNAYLYDEEARGKAKCRSCDGDGFVVVDTLTLHGTSEERLEELRKNI